LRPLEYGVLYWLIWVGTADRRTGGHALDGIAVPSFQRRQALAKQIRDRKIVLEAVNFLGCWMKWFQNRSHKSVGDPIPQI
jgi:hypothetical protein